MRETVKSQTRRPGQSSWSSRPDRTLGSYPGHCMQPSCWDVRNRPRSRCGNAYFKENWFLSCSPRSGKRDLSEMIHFKCQDSWLSTIERQTVCLMCARLILRGSIRILILSVLQLVRGLRNTTECHRNKIRCALVRNILRRGDHVIPPVVWFSLFPSYRFKVQSALTRYRV